jgi:hypothetical protein
LEERSLRRAFLLTENYPRSTRWFRGHCATAGLGTVPALQTETSRPQALQDGRPGCGRPYTALRPGGDTTFAVGAEPAWGSSAIRREAPMGRCKLVDMESAAIRRGEGPAVAVRVRGPCSPQGIVKGLRGSRRSPLIRVGSIQASIHRALRGHARSCLSIRPQLRSGNWPPDAILRRVQRGWTVAPYVPYGWCVTDSCSRWNLKCFIG